ncbi:GNAT family N-acetyltransferase [Terracidiphilus gabretensis]|uniref:GNAT family N-acetyltransferase n=1 Tax=Terracidiphilus gabretensis TaxID=1577687 RepID=UPI00071B2A33|nr:GNAT family N-acetyltransferase [Terracidiphilus gabretensis]
MLLRPAEPADAMAIACVHVRSWQAAYRSLLPQDYLDQLRPEDRAHSYDFTHQDPGKPYTIVAVEGPLILGFATTMPSRDEDLPDHGELCALHVDPEQWGHGTGAALIVAARDRLVQRGFQYACLWLLKGNTRAARFYEIDGWAADGKHKSETMFGVMVQDFRYRRRLDAK